MIRIEAVKKRFRRNTVLHDLTLDINAGDRIALVGSNGAGKTTLMRCLLAEYGYEGSIRIDGVEVATNRKKILERIGFVPQLPPPLKMPVMQLLDFAASVSHSQVGEIEAIGAQLGLDLEPLLHQPFNKLSGGQKQKILISIALARELDLLVLDEPAANLDPKARKTFFQLLGARHGDCTMLLSSHRLSEVASLVNRVIELESGRVIIDDRVAAAEDVDSLMTCALELHRRDDAFTRSMGEWGFTELGDESRWRGEVAAVDRLRFLGLLARYSSILKSVHLDDEKIEREALPDARTA